MSVPKISISRVLSVSWQTFANHAGLLLAANLLYLLIGTGIDQMQYISIPVYLLVEFPLAGGLVVIAHKAARGEDAEFNDFFCGFKNYWNWQKVGWLFLTALVVAVAPIGVIAALIISYLNTQYPVDTITPDTPQATVIIWAALFAYVVIFTVIAKYYCAFFLVADGVDPVEAFKQSAELTRSNRLRILGIHLIYGLLNVLGALLYGVGLIFTGALTEVLFAHMFLDLKALHAQASSATPPANETDHKQAA